MQTAEFVLTRSKRLTFFIHILHLAAGIVLLTLPLLLIGKCLAIVVLIGLWKKEMRLYNTATPSIPRQEISQFCHKNKALFVLENNRGLRSKVLVKGDSFHCSWFIILRLKTQSSIPPIKAPSRTITLFISRDALTDFEYRKLSQRLLSI